MLAEQVRDRQARRHGRRQEARRVGHGTAEYRPSARRARDSRNPRATDDGPGGTKPSCEHYCPSPGWGGPSPVAPAAPPTCHPRAGRPPFPAPPGAASGASGLGFTSGAADVAVAVNGVLVVEDAHTERVRIDGVPTGYAELAIAAGSGEKALRVWVEADHLTTIPLGAPAEAPMSALRGLATSLAGIALYSLLN